VNECFINVGYQMVGLQ